jgi:protein-disulfide isomerase
MIAMDPSDDDSNIAKKSNRTNDTKNKDSITMSRSTFYKIAIIGIIGLMVSAFFAGYSLHTLTNPVKYVSVPTSIPTTQVAPNLAPTTDPSQLPIPIPISIQNLSLGDAPFLGHANAEVSLVEYSDFQCPFCESFFSNALPQIKTEYIDTGKIKLVYKQFPLDFHQNAKPAAIASECANEQDKFWQYHDMLFSNQSSWEGLTGNQTRMTFISYATNLGLNTESFEECYDAKKYEDKINNDMSQGSVIGVTGTPSFFVGNDEKNYTSIEGAQPFESFKQIIDQKLS